MPTDNARCPGRPQLAASDVPRQMFIDRKVDQWYLFMGMGNWPKTGWLVSDIWPTVSIACDDWLAFLVTIWRSPVNLDQHLRASITELSDLHFPIWKESWQCCLLKEWKKTGRGRWSEIPCFKFRFLCRWQLLRPRSQTQMISITAFLIPVRGHNCFVVKNNLFWSLCLFSSTETISSFPESFLCGWVASRTLFLDW